MDKLKPCPLCGAEGKLYDFHSHAMGERYYSVKCSVVKCVGLGAFETAKAAAHAWNSRPGVEQSVGDGT